MSEEEQRCQIIKGGYALAAMAQTLAELAASLPATMDEKKRVEIIDALDGALALVQEVLPS